MICVCKYLCALAKSRLLFFTDMVTDARLIKDRLI